MWGVRVRIQVSKRELHTHIYLCRTDSTCLPGAAGAPKVTTQDQRGVPVGAIRVTVSELHEIWQVEGKRHSDPDS